MNKFILFGFVILIFTSCGGGSSSNTLESNSLPSSSASNSSSSSNSSSNSSSSTSSSQTDSSANIVNQTGCTPLVTGSNEADNDADGIINLFDICPDNPNITKALAFDFSNVSSIGLKTEMNSTVQDFSVKNLKNESYLKSFFKNIGKIIFQPLIAQSTSVTQELKNENNISSFAENGSEILNSILSDKSMFIAEAARDLDKNFIYLLTSNHIQNRSPDLDPEPCSIYKVKLSDHTFECLLLAVDGDIEPRSLNPNKQFDFFRGGFNFNNNNQAIFGGFNWNKEVETGGTQNTVGWFLDSQGNLSSLDSPGRFVNSYSWINDEFFALFENDSSYSNPSCSIWQVSNEVPEFFERIEGCTREINRFENAMYYVGKKVTIQNAGTNPQINVENFDISVPVISSEGKKLFSYAQPSLKSINHDDYGSEEINLELFENMSENFMYNDQKQTGTGTDIKFLGLYLGENYIFHLKSYYPKTPMISIEGEAFSRDKTFSLASGAVELEVRQNNQFFLTFNNYPAATDLVINYVVSDSSQLDGSNPAQISKSMIIKGSTIDNFIANSDESSLKWSNPEGDRDGFCVYKYTTKENKCSNFTSYDVFSFDLESLRETRWDDNTVYSDGNPSEPGAQLLGNAFPGIQTMQKIGDKIYIYFKDSKDHTYYVAAGNIEDYLIEGLSSLTVTESQNSAGEAQIISTAIQLD